MKLGQGQGHLVGSVSRVEIVDLSVMSSNPRLSIDKKEREREKQHSMGRGRCVQDQAGTVPSPAAPPAGPIFSSHL